MSVALQCSTCAMQYRIDHIIELPPSDLKLKLPFLRVALIVWAVSIAGSATNTLHMAETQILVREGEREREAVL